jgi:hypothetical protein
VISHFIKDLVLLRRVSDFPQIGGMLKAVDVHWEVMEPSVAIITQIWRLKFSELFRASGRSIGHVRSITYITACYFLTVCWPELVSSNTGRRATCRCSDWLAGMGTRSNEASDVVPCVALSTAGEP